MGATVPDLRGRFLRGLGGNSAGLGVNQGDAIRNMTGEARGALSDGGAGGADGVFRTGGYHGYGDGDSGNNVALTQIRH
jgi:hypothetical protein